MEPSESNGTPTPTNGAHANGKRRRSGWRRDGWMNFLSKIGTNKGLNANNSFEADIVTSDEAEELYRGDPLAARIVDLLPEDANRRGLVLKTDDKEVTEAICGELEDLQMTHWFTEAEKMERWAGGAALMPVINDSADNLGMPLDMDKLTMFSHFVLYEPRELRPVVWYDEADDPDPERRAKYGRTEIYRVQPIMSGGMVGQSTSYVHESRLVIFPGIKVSRRQSMSAEHGWGDGIFVRLRKKLGELNMSWESAFEIIQKFLLSVYKMDGFSKLMLANEDGDNDDVIVDKMMQADIAKSILNAMLVDKEDSFTREGAPVTGLPDLLQQGMSWFAAQCGYSVTKLFGISPAGLNATGEYDAVNYDDTIATFQSRHTPQREQIIRFVMLAKDGPTKGEEPELWSLEYKPQRTPSAKEDEETKYVTAQRDDINIQAGLYTADEAARSHYGGDTYSADIVIDWAEREKQLKAGEEAIAAGTSTDVQAEALNGAQVESLLAILDKIATKNLPREKGINALLFAFPTMTKEEAEGMAPDENFVPPAAAPKASPFAKPAPAADPTDPAQKMPAQKPPMKPPPEMMDNADAARSKDALVHKLSPHGVCHGCKTTVGHAELEIDHINGRDWDVAAVSSGQRSARYWEEHDAGVALQTLCRSCNASDGAKNKQKR